mmetsp:Transcript_13221/g.22429  ORF Transcript_13221/g.22429 Transcript_13221/m.22429 type:complete len:108 (+) Transcript_13221:416-739(+)
MKFVINQFFRDVIILGEHNVPKKGPVIFCGNHNNQFVDGIILLTNATRDVRFMVAATSMRRPLIGSLFRMGKSIPVERAQDLAFLGKGKLKFDDNLNVIGEGTKFLT